MKSVFLLFFILRITSFSFSQNLILNGDFEDVNICREFRSPCSTKAWRLTSSNLPDFHKSKKNNFLTIIVSSDDSKNRRTYLQSRLADTLIIGEKYQLSFDVIPNNLIINEIGVLFTETLVMTTIDTLLTLKPNIEFINNKRLLQSRIKSRPLRLKADFIADKNYIFIIIGCFHSDERLIKKFATKQKLHNRNYFYNIDNVKLISVNNLHDPDVIAMTKAAIYAQRSRHPVPDYFCNLVLKQHENDNNIVDEDEFVQQSDTLILKSELLFNFDSYEITSTLASMLDSVFLYLPSTPESVTIVGHTDNVGSEEYNEDLSLKRAKSIADYLAENNIIPIEKIVCFGKGSSSPIDDNDTEEGRQNNRRVEIIVRYW